MKKILKSKYIIIILIATLIIFLNLFINPRYYGHDTIFHTANIIELSKTINIHNIFGNNIVSFESNHFGYGTWLFYPKLPHLLGAYLYKIFNIYTSMKIVYFITTLLSVITMYYLSKIIYKNKKIALLSSLIYLTVPYHICEIYIRDAYAENFMFLASPLIFLGLYNLLENNYKKFYIFFILGYLIGIYSHLVSMVFCTILVALFLLYYHKKIFEKEKIKALIISTLIVTGLSLPFLIKVIEYKSLNIYTVFLSQSFTSRDMVIYRRPSFKNLIINKPIYDLIMPYFNILTIILFMITTIQIIFKKNKYRKELIPILLFIILLINLICSKLIWKNMPDIFLMIQFSWRLLVFLSMFISIYAPACIITNLKIPKQYNKILYTLLTILILIEGLNNINYYSEKEYTENEILQSKYVMGYQYEYYPHIINTNLKSQYHYLTYVDIREDGIITDDENISINIISEDFPKLTFEVKNITKKTKIELPRIYYLGYVLKDKDGNKIKLKMNDNGFLEATIKVEGKYTLYHTDTTVEKIANLIARLTILLIIIYGGKYRYERKKNSSINTML